MNQQQTCLNASLILSYKQELEVKVTINKMAMKTTSFWPTETTAHQLALSLYLHCSITPTAASSPGILGQLNEQQLPGICKSYSWNVAVIQRITVNAVDNNWICLSGSVKGKQSCQVPDWHDQFSLES